MSMEELIKAANSTEYRDAHMKDEQGVSWVKVEYANKLLNANESPHSPGCSMPISSNAIEKMINSFVSFVGDYFIEISKDERGADLHIYLTEKQIYEIEEWAKRH